MFPHRCIHWYGISFRHSCENLRLSVAGSVERSIASVFGGGANNGKGKRHERTDGKIQEA